MGAVEPPRGTPIPKPSLCGCSSTCGHAAHAKARGRVSAHQGVTKNISKKIQDRRRAHALKRAHSETSWCAHILACMQQAHECTHERIQQLTRWAQSTCAHIAGQQMGAGARGLGRIECLVVTRLPAPGLDRSSCGDAGRRLRLLLLLRGWLHGLLHLHLPAHWCCRRKRLRYDRRRNHRQVQRLGRLSRLLLFLLQELVRRSNNSERRLFCGPSSVGFEPQASTHHVVGRPLQCGGAQSRVVLCDAPPTGVPSSASRQVAVDLNRDRSADASRICATQIIGPAING